MELTDLTKEVQRLLLAHWSQQELTSHLSSDAEYFFEHVVVSQLDYLRRQGQDIPRIRLKRSPTGGLTVGLNR